MAAANRYLERHYRPAFNAEFAVRAAEFLYVPAADVMKAAGETGAIPYDVPGVELGHVGELCSVEAFLKKYQITDAALQRLAVIVRGADTGKPILAPEAAGLLAISRGLSLNFENDHEMLKHGMVMYDALYAWCKTAGER